MDLTEISLRLIGAFYAFAGYVAVRAALMSHFVDGAIAAIAAKQPTRTERMQAVWLLCAALVIFAGGLLLTLLLDLAAWVFLASVLGQALYLFVVAPRIFDVDDPPDPRSRRQSTNAFVIYAAAAAFVLWAALTGRLIRWHLMPWPVLAMMAAAIAGYAGYVVWTFTRPMGSGSPLGLGGLGNAETVEFKRAQSRRVKVMADYDCHPLWTLDESLYGNFAPEDLDLSEDLTRDLDAWADAYTASLNRDDPVNSLWSDEQTKAHAAQARPLAVRLARERPDLMVYVLEPDIGVVEVRADEEI